LGDRLRATAPAALRRTGCPRRIHSRQILRVTTLLVLAAVAAAVAIGFAIGFVIGGAQRRGQRRAPDATPASPPLMDASPAAAQSAPHEAERRRLEGELAQARAETARYRALIVDIENNAPSPLMGPGAPDDLKLIVGVGPVLERMLHQLGVTTFRQVAYWSERDIDEFDAKLHEFPGRIRRDGWVTQARALHQSKYGEALPIREPK
jgi:predicted flap endonuclease-1-like 5' DNA nuclease